MTGVDEVRGRIGRYGVWRRHSAADGALAAHLESLGFGAFWLGGSPPGDLRVAEELLDATTSLVVATGIVNIWNTDPAEVADSHRRITAKHPGRFLLGIGAGHPESAGKAAQKPYGALLSYLDAVEAGGVPREELVLAALGPRVLRLAAQRTLGAHPYLTTPEHSRRARELLGAGPLIAPEQRVVLETDPEAARSVARPTIQTPYLGLVNYRRNLLSLGYAEQDLAGAGSDRLVDGLTAYGTGEQIAARVEEHLAGGADHVALQLLVPEGQDLADAYRRLAGALGLAGA